MPETVQCPDCQSKLKVPETLLGKSVKCPKCGSVFKAAAGDAAEAPVPEAPVRERPAARPRTPPPEPDEEFEEGDEGGDEDRPRRPRRRRGGYEAPHRGGLVLTLGILSIPLACCPIVGLILGIVSLVMANADLGKMQSGAMDPSGQGTTRGGQICGIIGIALSVINMVVGVIINLQNMH
jgi:predicted Zn finger-like uncharacterized protein